MASLLRQIVAGPRLKHADTGLDLCYVTEDIIVTSGPSTSYPKMAYRTPIRDLVSYLDKTHGTSWAVWEFRAEGTGYPDTAVHDRILHFPYPDHQPPPFRLVPDILASMRNWLAGGELKAGGVTGVPSEGGEAVEKGSEGVAGKDGEGAGETGGKKGNGRVVVVHCKAGKGRSGTMTTAFLIAEQNWKAEDAFARFTERRMRPGFGQGVSILSQRRYVGYVDRWASHGKHYADRKVQVLEIHMWGVRDGVSIEVEGFVEGGRKIKAFHRFTHGERTVVDAGAGGRGSGVESESEAASASAESVSSGMSVAKKAKGKLRSSMLVSKALGRMSVEAADTPAPSPSSSRSRLSKDNDSPPGPTPPSATPTTGQTIVLKPSTDVILETSDVKISVQRRSKTRQLAPSIVTSVAHVWFNTFFEGKGPEAGKGEESGAYEVGWDEMDGLKGFMRVGTQAFDRMAVVWRAVGPEEEIVQPGPGEDVVGVPPADWRGEDAIVDGVEAEAEVEVGKGGVVVEVEEGERAGLKSSGPGGEVIKALDGEDIKGGKGEDIKGEKGENIKEGKEEDIKDVKGEVIRALKGEVIKDGKDVDTKDGKDVDTKDGKGENIKDEKDEKDVDIKGEETKGGKGEDAHAPNSGSEKKHASP